MPIFVVSDMHLMDRPQAFLFNRRKEKAFCQLCEIVLETDGSLVLAGDIFDLTGMTPCQNGQIEFFEEAVPAAQLDAKLIQEKSAYRSTENLLFSIRNIYPHFFHSLSRLAKKGKLIYIPGNHDCDFLKSSPREIFARALEVPNSQIQWADQYQWQKSLVVVHGNQYDPPNRTPGTCRNPGFVFTSALYQAVLPALQMLGVEETVLDAIPAVRPEEETIVGIQNYLGAEKCRELLIAFVRLLQRNGYFEGLHSIPGWFLGHDFPVLSRLFRRGVTPERIRSLLPKEAELMASSRNGAENLRREMALQDPQFQSALFVVGHTHELDHQNKYLNLGTWIDHIRGLDPEDIEQAEVSLPALMLEDDGDAYLYNVRPLQEKASLLDCPIIASVRRYSF